jgi:hypothetical protein
MARPDLEELMTLELPEDVPDEARVTITAGELRTLLSCVSAAREIRDTFGTLDQPRWEE